ncbi:hypothetical protein F2P81_007764 [Scophthalmus maximus]|uniref:Uncharacterized protein n=1 Tax=Scophthalmus maximus TaxID=52904 RepID=A0A6A4T3R9_SCOMX|nr:hypothetical protein F2P81_007764 [Scophthalmus maximus]
MTAEELEPFGQGHRIPAHKHPHKSFVITKVAAVKPLRHVLARQHSEVHLICLKGPVWIKFDGLNSNCKENIRRVWWCSYSNHADRGITHSTLPVFPAQLEKTFVALAAMKVVAIDLARTVWLSTDSVHWRLRRCPVNHNPTLTGVAERLQTLQRDSGNMGSDSGIRTALVIVMH